MTTTAVCGSTKKTRLMKLGIIFVRAVPVGMEGTSYNSGKDEILIKT